jgi:hypothetical protein
VGIINNFQGGFGFSAQGLRKPKRAVRYIFVSESHVP